MTIALEHVVPVVPQGIFSVITWKFPVLFPHVSLKTKDIVILQMLFYKQQQTKCGGKSTESPTKIKVLLIVKSSNICSKDYSKYK